MINIVGKNNAGCPASSQFKVPLHNPLTKVVSKSWASFLLVLQASYGTNYRRSLIA